ncbi:PP2C family protein-serine/threonine phosphatase [Streptomyces solicathayae]|uniref:PP2C family protein-serine/threonine phosphatase n=1 Tax=Streptomyces solicathayae TaxID=3081768 RepID=A0ABZ0M197_9ACTN|nr:PP2C family protein-serine/threonine phosphatase [Streptomyces sp. HUAS YS2]WOX25410.1 PP2C family protein-serine/threonine phosphatase [Streptomyces sp. HUAS YS2]
MIRTRSSLSEGSRFRRLGPLVLPGAWGAVAVTWKLGCPLAQQPGLPMRIATSVVFFSVGTGLVLGIRRGLARELERMRAIAHAAQRVLLRPVPPRLDGLVFAAAQLSAARGAEVGGDLYGAAATPFGVRVLMGDARGHGLAALGAVAAVLGSFREAAHDEPELGGVLRRLDRALGRHLRERARDEHPAAGGAEPEHPAAEEFVTVLLLEIRPDGTVYALNCGHPGPYRLAPRVESLPAGDPLPPLGAFPLPAELIPHRCTRLRPGEALLLHTDGAEDARDAAGRFFALDAVLADAVRDAPVSPAAVVRRVHTALLRHTGGRLADDVALLVVRNDRARVPAQPAEPGLRRSRPAPSPR